MIAILTGPSSAISNISSTRSSASPDPHYEGGGDNGAVVIYNTRGSSDGVVFDVLDEQQNTVGALEFSDLVAMFAAQDNRPGARAVLRVGGAGTRTAVHRNNAGSDRRALRARERCWYDATRSGTTSTSARL